MKLTIKQRKTLYLVLSIVLGISIALLLYTSFFIPEPVETKTVYTSFTATDDYVVGINLSASELTFGRLPAGSSGKRYIVLTNDHPFAVRLKTYSSGNISPYLALGDYDFSLEPGEEKNLTISVNAPLKPLGYYDGYILFAFYKK